jgi:redox-sensitive bicupin YhaK (pirin superfamily)
MAIAVRRAKERGHADHGWLDTWHSFSFADYYDPRFMGFRVLRVINEDTVVPGRGFPTHGHRDMEIISYVLEGALEHRDSLGTGSVIRPGDVQRLSAGTGVRHSEFNASATEPVHFLQIWIEPVVAGLAPEYEQKTFTDTDKLGRLRLVASPDGAEGSVTIHQDARLYATRLGSGNEVVLRLAAGRHAWVQVARGAATVAAHPLGHGDGIAISGEPAVPVAADTDCELLLFDLP